MNLFTVRLFPRFTKLLVYISAVLLLAVCSSASAQVQPSELSVALKGKTVFTRVAFGVEGFPAGVSGSTGLGATTLAYPDGHVVYRIESGFLHADAVRITRSIPAGSSIQITSVEQKGDRLELKLSDGQETAHVKLMLAKDWESTMKATDVFGALETILQLPETHVATTTEIAHSSATPGSSAPHYARPTTTEPLPERLPEAEVQALLNGLNGSMNQANEEVRQSVLNIAAAFKAFQGVHAAERGMPALRDIQEVFAEVGNPPYPRKEEDIDLISQVYGECQRVAAMRGQSGNDGRPILSGGRTADYQRAFGGRDQASDVSELRAAFSRRLHLTDAENSILAIETALDSGDLKSAALKLDALAINDQHFYGAPVYDYIKDTQPLHEDLDTFLRLAGDTDRAKQSLSDQLKAYDKDKQAMPELAAKPLSSAFLGKRLAEDHARIEAKLNALIPLDPTPTIPWLDANYARNARPSPPTDQIGQVADDVRLNMVGHADLTAIALDPKLMQEVQADFGDATYQPLLRKAKSVQKANALEQALMLEFNKRSAEAALLERKRAEESADRAAFAQNLVRDAVIITECQSEFQKTHLMAWSLEEDKRQKDFDQLVRENSKNVTPAMKAQVKAAFDRVLPQLTLEQSIDVQNLLDRWYR